MALTTIKYPTRGDDYNGLVYGTGRVQSRTPVSRFTFTWIDHALTSLLANQPVASEAGRARYHCLRAAVTMLVDLRFSFVSGVPRYLIYVIAVDS